MLVWPFWGPGPAAAVVAVLNLKRVSNLGMMWLSPPLMIFGIALIAMAGRRR